MKREFEEKCDVFNNKKQKINDNIDITQPYYFETTNLEEIKNIHKKYIIIKNKNPNLEMCKNVHFGLLGNVSYEFGIKIKGYDFWLLDKFTFTPSQ
jgi:hypothetical protein